MGRPVRELQRSISSAEFTEWMAYAGIEPFGEERADLRMAILAALTANIHRSSTSAPFDVSTFMPKFEPEPAQDAREVEMEIESILRGHIRAHEERERRRGK